jgi:hypothetical protein
MAAEISVRLSKKLQKDLAAVVAATGKSEADILRAALQEYCAKQEFGPSAYDVAKKAGLIGCVKGLAPDLSTNKKYMEGFGRD